MKTQQQLDEAQGIHNTSGYGVDGTRIPGGKIDISQPALQVGALPSTRGETTDQYKARVAALQGSLSPSVPTSSFVTDSTTAVNNENDITATVNGLGIPDPSVDADKKASDERLANLKAQREDLLRQQDEEQKRINEQFDATQRETADSQTRETGTTNVALQRVGGYLGTQMSAVGVLNNLEVTHRAEMATLQSKRQAALQAAKNAITEKDFKLAEQMATEAKDIAKTISERKQKFFDNTLAITKAQQEKQKSENDATAFKQSQEEKVSESISAIVSDQLGGDFDSPESQKFLVDTAKSYGIDASVLYSKVKEYDTKKNLDMLNQYTNDQKDYEYAVNKSGYKGTFTQYLAWKKSLDAKVAAAASTGASLGLPPDSPIYFATIGTNSDKLREAYIGQYAEMKKAGKHQQAADFVNRLIYQSLPAAQKTEFQTYNSSLQVGTKALALLDNMKTKDFNVYKTVLEQATPLVVLERDQKWVDAVAKIELAQAQIRRAFFGTAVTDAEKSSADGFLIDKATDDLGSARTKLAGLMEYAEQHKLNYFQAGLGQFEGVSSGAPATVNIRGKDYTVGSIVENDKKQRGIVGADGKITLIQ